MKNTNDTRTVRVTRITQNWLNEKREPRAGSIYKLLYTLGSCPPELSMIIRSLYRFSEQDWAEALGMECSFVKDLEAGTIQNACVLRNFEFAASGYLFLYWEEERLQYFYEEVASIIDDINIIRLSEELRAELKPLLADSNTDLKRLSEFMSKKYGLCESQLACCFELETDELRRLQESTYLNSDHLYENVVKKDGDLLIERLAGAILFWVYD